MKITTSTKTPDAEQLERINEVVDRLVASRATARLRERAAEVRWDAAEPAEEPDKSARNVAVADALLA